MTTKKRAKSVVEIPPVKPVPNKRGKWIAHNHRHAELLEAKRKAKRRKR